LDLLKIYKLDAELDAEFDVEFDGDTVVLCHPCYTVLSSAFNPFSAFSSILASNWLQRAKIGSRSSRQQHLQQQAAAIIIQN
jgi:hypothetical protein